MTFRESFKLMDWEDISKMSNQELKSTLRSAQKLVNQDFKKVSALSDSSAPAVRGLEESGGKITTKGNRAQMLSELNRARKYLYSKTGTITGWRKYEEKTSKIVKGYSNFSAEEKRNFWKYVDDFRNKNSNLYQSIGSGDTIQKINEIFQSGNITPEIVQGKMESFYEEKQESKEEFSSRKFFS